METINTKNNIEKAYKLNEDCDLNNVSNIVADEILVTKEGQAIAIYNDSKPVVYSSLDDLLEAQSADTEFYFESGWLVNFWNNSESIDASRN
jgi:hypothetical protein